ncbi:M48 family metalloprotease [Lentzea jiangxiensis]|uniref:Peptidase family M48 n=1 Tax=Lentzea jiangxiensis TaxID=641025 RepID=A0A1H0UK13_9PSEU|nr:M48 family metalloprotease [Lentzea jiangxiensis]SDP66308.1 Peptidase family M48 [Lentzea jiangxiensis]
MTVEPVSAGADERVIGAGTTVRFVLLMVLLFVASGSMMSEVASGVSGSDDVGCLLAGGADPDASTLQVQLVLLQQMPAYDECVARHQPQPPWWVVLGWPLVVLLGAAVLFRAIPAWRARSRWVKPLGDTHDAHRLVAEAVATAGLVRTPRLVVDPTKGVVVYGSNRRPTLRLSATLLLSATTDPEHFRGVVLHELAHIRNGDVTLHYITTAVWRMFLGAVLVPYAVWTAVTLAQPTWWSGDQPIQARRILLVLLLVLLVYLARADVLRSREVCADLAAARWGAATRIWTTTAPASARRWAASFVELWRTHPRSDLRRAAVAGSGELFGLRALPMFLTGVAATLVNAQVLSYVAPYLARGGLLRESTGQALTLVSSALVVGVIGIALWRAVVHSVRTSRPAPPGWRIGLWFGAGLAVGELFLNRIAVTEWLPPHPEFLLLVVLAGTGLVWWIGQCARLWAVVGRTTWPVMAAALGAAWLALSSWFVWWQSNGTVYTRGTPIGTDQVRDLLVRGLGGPATDHAPVLSAVAAGMPVLNGLSTPVLAVVSVCALWIVPLLAWTVRPADGTPRWLRAALAGVVVVREAPVPLLRRALLPGVAGGAVAGAAVVAMQAYLHTWRPLPPGSGALFALTYQTAVFVVVVAAPAVAAVVAAVLAGRYRLLVALIAAQVAAVAGLGLALVFLSLDGCAEPLRVVESTCGPHFAMSGMALRTMLAPVFVIATIAAFVAAAVVGIVRRAPVVAARAPGTLAVRRRVIAGLCVAAVAVAATGAALWDRSSGEVSEGQVTAVFAPAATAQVPARTQAAQVYAWTRYGGMDLNRRLADIMKRHTEALNAPGSATGQVDVLPLRKTCAEFGQIAQDAQRYFRVPDAVAQQHWSRFVTLAQRGSAHCVTALEAGPQRLLLRSLDELANAMSEASSALGRVVQVAGG